MSFVSAANSVKNARRCTPSHNQDDSCNRPAFPHRVSNPHWVSFHRETQAEASHQCSRSSAEWLAPPSMLFLSPCLFAIGDDIRRYQEESPNARPARAWFNSVNPPVRLRRSKAGGGQERCWSPPDRLRLSAVHVFCAGVARRESPAAATL